MAETAGEMTVGAMGADATAAKLRDAVLDIRSQLSSHIIGQENTIDAVLSAILAGGHVLLEGGPGLGKTLLIKLLGRLLGLSVKRIQFTPDLMPSDILGGQVLESTPHGPEARFRPGRSLRNVFLRMKSIERIQEHKPRCSSDGRRPSHHR